MLPNLLLVAGVMVLVSAATRLHTILGALLVALGVLLRIFAGPIADRLAHPQSNQGDSAGSDPADCGPGG